MKTIQTLILVLLMSSIQNALANPCPTADKYAKQPDGCSSWSNNPQQFRDRWGPVDFRPSCMSHDKCYYTLGTSEASCNNAFARNLISACRDGLRVCRNIAGRRVCTPPEPASFSACSAFAGGMVALVRAASRSVYRKAQRKQREHENQCAARINQHTRCQNSPNIEVRVGNRNVDFGRSKSWRTCSGYHTIFQGDGNFVVYNPAGRAVWASNTNGKGGQVLAMQTDGNLVIYASGGRPIWASNTAGNPGSFLAIQQDGNVVIYSRHGRAIWATGTNGK